MTYRVRHAEMHQEDDLVEARYIGLFMGVVVVVSAVMIILAVWLLNRHIATLRPSDTFPEQYLGPRHAVARVRQDVFGEMQRRGASQTEQAHEDLSSYGWVDEAHGVVRIPIDRAIDLVVEGRRP